ncbi:hypothetical protein ABOM_009990 [Aspergillus bombycis]|uniref:Uncharacterized protein n=1 Tax=Aspergillus bombycis TaxID=109264 RepID=A0A1F7ZQE1_9EURO|nr:hypothetical protein ABOM_009990 [Aspergillus bombycis]OGM41671.1 hypothetical protein ABOM_009990 [Aspergillus bombycis]
MSLFNDASDGSLTRQKLEEHLRRSPNINNTSGNGETALGLAIKNGHTSAVSLLLKFGANPATRNIDGRSPLYLIATAPEKKRVRLAELLLNAGARIDESVPAYGNNTPLMVAITQAKDPKLIHALVEAGASLTQTNDRGESAKTLARDSMDPAIQRALVPGGDPTRAYKPELGNLLTTAGQFAAAYFGDWKDVAKDAVDRIAQYLHRDAALNEGLKELHTVEDFKDFLWDYIDRQGLEDFYPANDPRIQAIAEAAVAFRKKPEAKALSVQPALSLQTKSLFVQTSGLSVQTTAPTTKNLLTLAVAQLYTPVLYIDDSGSMGWGLQGQNDTSSSKRVDAAKHLVGELMDILDWVNPDALQGIGTTSIRFINRDVGNADKLTSDQIKQHMSQMTLPGGTPLGTNLRSKILNPLIYNPINANQDLRAPYLIMTIGDGVPNGETRDTFRNEIVGAANFLKGAKYSPEAVKFTFSQIGTDADAEAFRNELINNPLPDHTLYVSSDRFDQDYDINKGNSERLKANLMSWLSGLVDLK